MPNSDSGRKWIMEMAAKKGLMILNIEHVNVSAQMLGTKSWRNLQDSSVSSHQCLALEVVDTICWHAPCAWNARRWVSKDVSKILERIKGRVALEAIWGWWHEK